MTVLFLGFLTGMSLIAAIGAQNAFVLRQGIRSEHVLPVIAVCITGDFLLIAAGIGGRPSARSRSGMRRHPPW
ncbi:hypothetical protein EPJ93_21010, partial [Mycobacteroides abscessus subsp. abscessus]|uniref:LysE/ArgO family amino acid transporter n=1 Tax=Mycobacteroides abscessus TaxID=36809 RepID=UPI000FF2058B